MLDNLLGCYCCLVNLPLTSSSFCSKGNIRFIIIYQAWPLSYGTHGICSYLRVLHISLWFSCSSDSPVLWLRIDPDMTWTRQVCLEQPDYMWQYQLRYERDVTSQIEVGSLIWYTFHLSISSTIDGITFI